MQFYRLVKPVWAQPTLANGEPNDKFVKAIDGPNILEGCDFSNQFLADKNRLGYNVYFFPNHPSVDVYKQGTRHLSGKHIDVFNFVFVDMDLKDGKYSSKEEFYDKLSSFPLKPTMVVDSGNGVHAYWRIKDLTRAQYVITQLGLLNYFQTDESVWTVLQLMRVPMFFNTKKHDNYIQSLIKEELSSGQVYTIDLFPKEIYNLDEKLLNKADNHIARLEGRMEIDLGKDVNVDELPEEFIELTEKDKKIHDLFYDPKGAAGDRSSADMKLANILFNKKFNIKQALAVLSNTQKALEKGLHRMEYAQLTVSKVYSDRPKNKFQTVSEFLNQPEETVSEPQVLGPHYLDYDVLGEPWRKKELLALLAGPGVGKTAMAMNIIRDIIQNNPHNDEVFVFFSLEMTKKQIINRWVKLVGGNSKLADRLYVVENKGPDGMPINVGLQEIYEYCAELKQTTGKEIGALAIDHFHIISSHINVNKKPNFGITAEQNVGWGGIRNLSLNALATQLKALVKALDTFGIILSQTTKEKGVGDLPIGKDGAYGVSQFEWIMDRIVSIWQPLMRVQNECDTKFLAFQYSKIREKHPKDKIFEYDPKLLTYDMHSGNLRVTTEDEYHKFMEFLPKANAAREALQKKKSDAYSIQIDLKELDAAVEKLRAVK